MSEGLNRWQGIGNLGSDPELRVTPGGQSVLKLRLACTESYLDKANVRQERTEWASITVWGKRGEGLAKILGKGDRIYVEGSMRTSSYEKDGEKRYRTEIVASNVILNGGRGGADRQERQEEPRGNGGGGYGGGQPPARQPQQAPPPSDFGGGDYSDDEIPFVRNMTLSGAWDRP